MQGGEKMAVNLFDVKPDLSEQVDYICQALNFDEVIISYCNWSEDAGDIMQLGCASVEKWAVDGDQLKLYLVEFLYFLRCRHLKMTEKGLTILLLSKNPWIKNCTRHARCRRCLPVSTMGRTCSFISIASDNWPASPSTKWGSQYRGAPGRWVGSSYPTLLLMQTLNTTFVGAGGKKRSFQQIRIFHLRRRTFQSMLDAQNINLLGIHLQRYL